jgi:hypothetical protein
MSWLSPKLTHYSTEQADRLTTHRKDPKFKEEVRAKKERARSLISQVEEINVSIEGLNITEDTKDEVGTKPHPLLVQKGRIERKVDRTNQQLERLTIPHYVDQWAEQKTQEVCEALRRLSLMYDDEHPLQKLTRNWPQDDDDLVVKNKSTFVKNLKKALTSLALTLDFRLKTHLTESGAIQSR